MPTVSTPSVEGTESAPASYLSNGSSGSMGYPSISGIIVDDEVGIFGRLRRRKLVFISFFLIVLACVGAAYYALPRTYRAAASVVVSVPDMVLSSTQGPAYSQMQIGDPADLESQGVLLGSTQVVRDVLRRPGIREALIAECELSQPSPWMARIRARFLPDPSSCSDQVDDRDKEVVTLQSRIFAATAGRSRIIEASVVSPSPQTAQLLVNAVVQAYIDLRTNEKLRPRDAAIQWLQAEIDRLGGKLHKSETTIEAFLTSHNLVRGQNAPIASETLTVLSQQLAVAQADQAMAAGRMGQNSVSSDTRDVLSSRTVADIKNQLELVNGQVAQMSARYGPAYPGLAALLQQRAGLQAALGAETSRVTSSMGHDYQATSARVTALQQQVDALKRQVGAGDSAMTQIAALQRDTDVDRELYLDLTKRVNQLQSERRLVVGDAKLVNFSELPSQVFFPKKLTFAVTGLLLATAAAASAAFLRDRADSTVRASGSLQAAAGVRVLAHVPRVRRLGSSSSRLAQQLERPSSFQEAIRGLYAECALVDRTNPLRTLMVTSSLSGEGKTFITLALAHFAAAAGQRVLALECDLRQPSFQRALLLASPALGLSDFLRGKGKPEDLVVRSKTPGLDVALCGRAATNSTELLSNRRIRQLLDWATTQYDLVLIDTPPNQLLRDTRVLARHMDGVLYCAQWAQSHTSNVLEGILSIQAAGGNVIGIVLDRVETDQYKLYDPRAASQAAYPALVG